MNKESLRALEEVKSGNLNTYKDVDEMFDKLGIKIMKTYRRITIEVTAEQYNGPNRCSDVGKSNIRRLELQLGHFEGVVVWHQVKIIEDGVEYLYPFVVCNNRDILVQKTDWIVTKEDGERIVLSNYEFKRDYQEIE